MSARTLKSKLLQSWQANSDGSQDPEERRQLVRVCELCRPEESQVHRRQQGGCGTGKTRLSKQNLPLAIWVFFRMLKLLRRRKPHSISMPMTGLRDMPPFTARYQRLRAIVSCFGCICCRVLAHFL